MQLAGLLTDNSPHFIDHLAPFCASVKCPLIVWEDSLIPDCHSFYPDLQVLQTKVLPTHVVSCITRPHLHQTLGLFQPSPDKVIWLPHGLSDKGWKEPFFEALSTEDLLLVYGKRMRDVLEKKKIQIPQFSVGNFRKKYYEKNRTFYDNLVTRKFENRRFILYAPTWEDCEKNGSFWNSFSYFLNHTPPSISLLIKLHPNTVHAHLPRIEECKGAAQKTSYIYFLDDFFPIYPLLERCDAYIGDMSSIGYDFLSFDRPLFFLRKKWTDPAKDPSAFLMQAGEQILIEEIPGLLRRLAVPRIETQALSSSRKTLLEKAFDVSPFWESEFLSRIAPKSE